MTTPSHEDELSGRELGAYLMEGVLLKWCLAAAPQIAIGARFRWCLDGEVEGNYLMELLPERIGVLPVEADATDAADQDAELGEVQWTLGKSDFWDFLHGKYKLATAFREKKLVFDGTDAGHLKLAWVFDALASANPAAMDEDPQAYFQQRALDAAAPKLDELFEEDTP